MKTGKKVFLLTALTLLFLMGMSTGVFAKDVMLKDGKWVKGTTCEKEDDNTYYKIRIPKTGYIRVDYQLGAESLADGEIYLYDSKKKILSLSESEDGPVCFALRKGTYYIQSRDTGEWDEESEDNRFLGETYRLRYRFTSYKEQGKKVTKMSKAPLLKKNRTVKGLLFPGEAEENSSTCAALYKIKVPQTSKVTFDIKLGSTVNMGPDIRITLLDSKGRRLYNGRYDKKKYTSYETGKETVKLSAGTYYIRVDQFFVESSGYYSISWR